MRPETYDLWWDAHTERITPEGPATPGQVITAWASGLGKRWEVRAEIGQIDVEKHQIDVTTPLQTFALIVTVGVLQFHDGEKWAEVHAGEMLLINPGERHRYRADVGTSAYLIYAGLPGVRSRTWTVRKR